MRLLLFVMVCDCVSSSVTLIEGSVALSEVSDLQCAACTSEAPSPDAATVFGDRVAPTVEPPE